MTINQAGKARKPYTLHSKAPRELGFIPPPSPWIRAVEPTSCPHCGSAGKGHIYRMWPYNDGWDCRVCGWNTFDPGADPDREVISNTGRHQRAKPGETDA